MNLSGARPRVSLDSASGCSQWKARGALAVALLSLTSATGAAPVVPPASTGAVVPDRSGTRGAPVASPAGTNGTAPLPAKVSGVAAGTAPKGAVGGTVYEDEPIRRAPAAGATTTGASAPAGSGSTSAVSWGYSRVPAALAAVLILIFGFRWLMGKMTASSTATKSTRAMQVLARSTIAPRQQLMLIQVGKRLVLVGNSCGAMSPLCQIDDPDEVATLIGQVKADKIATPISSFKSLFGRANSDFDAPAPIGRQAQTSAARQPTTANREPEIDDDEEALDDHPSSASAGSATSDYLAGREVRDEVQLSGSAPAAAQPASRVRSEPVKPVTGGAAGAEAPASSVPSGELTALMDRIRKMSQGLQR